MPLAKLEVPWSDKTDQMTGGSEGQHLISSATPSPEEMPMESDFSSSRPQVNIDIHPVHSFIYLFMFIHKFMIVSHHQSSYHFIPLLSSSATHTIFRTSISSYFLQCMLSWEFFYCLWVFRWWVLHSRLWFTTWWWWSPWLSSRKLFLSPTLCLSCFSSVVLLVEWHKSCTVCISFNYNKRNSLSSFRISDYILSSDIHFSHDINIAINLWHHDTQSHVYSWCSFFSHVILSLFSWHSYQRILLLYSDQPSASSFWSSIENVPGSFLSSLYFSRYHHDVLLFLVHVVNHVNENHAHSHDYNHGMMIISQVLEWK